MITGESRNKLILFKQNHEIDIINSSRRLIMLKKGDRAPMFKLSDQNGKAVSLKDFSDKKVLVYFYGKALTSG